MLAKRQLSVAALAEKQRALISARSGFGRYQSARCRRWRSEACDQCPL